MFEKYPIINYPIKETDSEIVYKQLRDITTNIRIDPDTLSPLVNYDKRVLIDGEAPEITANEAYNNSMLHYLVMLSNDDYDWRDSYPLTQLELDSLISEKYAHPNAIHHYEDAYGNIVDNIDLDDEDAEGNPIHIPELLNPITNAEYERQLNEQRRYKKVIKPEYILSVQKLAESKINNG